jgi:DNA uptake protein ComE-like DNA-binding protein
MISTKRHLSIPHQLRITTKDRNPETQRQSMKGFLTGIGLGTVIGLWLAPDSGSQTRKKLMTRAAEFADNLEKALAGKSAELDGHSHIQAEESSENHESPQNSDAVAEVLNSASKTQLRKVPGIGDATARRIIENRPFESEAEVVESKVLSESVLKKLKNKLVDDEEDIA